MRFTIKVILPVFDASAPVSAALNDEDCRHAGAVIVTAGANLVLHRYADLAQTLAQQSGSLRLGALEGQPIDSLSEADVKAFGIDLTQLESQPYPPTIHTTGFALARAVISRSYFRMHKEPSVCSPPSDGNAIRTVNDISERRGADALTTATESSDQSHERSNTCWGRSSRSWTPISADSS